MDGATIPEMKGNQDQDVHGWLLKQLIPNTHLQSVSLSGLPPSVSKPTANLIERNSIWEREGGLKRVKLLAVTAHFSIYLVFTFLNW